MFHIMFHISGVCVGETFTPTPEGGMKWVQETGLSPPANVGALYRSLGAYRVTIVFMNVF